MKAKTQRKPTVYSLITLTLIMFFCVFLVIKTTNGTYTETISNSSDINQFTADVSDDSATNAPSFEMSRNHDGSVSIHMVIQPQEFSDSQHITVRDNNGNIVSESIYRTDIFGIVHNEDNGNFSSSGLISVIISIYVLACAFTLFRAFFQQLKYNIYSYNTIFYMGFGLFALSSGISLLSGSIRNLQNPGTMPMKTVYSMVLHSGITYLKTTFPFIAAFGAAMAVSNIVLLKKEGKRLNNVLGIILGIILIGSDILIITLDAINYSSAQQIETFTILLSIFAAVCLYAECMLTGSIIASFIAATHRPAFNKDSVFILGCGLNKDGTPTPLLKGRCDQAIQFYRMQLKETGKAPLLIASGGQGEDEVISEAASMKNYLFSQSIPESHICCEDHSKSTRQNMLFSKKIIHASSRTKIAFCTTNYHVFRAGIIANECGLHCAEGIGAPTKWYFWPNAWAREFAGIMANQRLKQFLVLSFTIGAYALLGVFLG